MNEITLKYGIFFTWVSAMEAVQPIVQFGQDIVFGLGMMAIVLLFNGYLYSLTMVLHARLTQHPNCHSSFLAICVFVGCVLLLAIIQIVDIAIWATGTHTTGLIPNLTQAILYSGSCFTTIGLYSDMLPVDWKATPLFIAFSGLFSFAWATSIMMTMAASLKTKLSI